MEFLTAIIETLVKMIIIAAFAFGGIQFGRYFRKKKEEKDDK